MSSSLRVARLNSAELAPLSGERDAVFARHDALRQIIARHLPHVTASLLARPQVVGDGSTFEWYSDLTGQPRRLSDLPAAEQAAARKLLDERVASVTRLADELPRLEPQSAHYADALREAVSVPGDDYIYIVGDQPVLTFWGHRDPRIPVVPAAATTAAITRSRWPWLAGLVAMLLLALLLWWLWPRDAMPPLVAESKSEPDLLQPEAVVEPDPVGVLHDLFDQALGDCDKLVEFDRTVMPDPTDDNSLQILRNKLDLELAACRERRLADLNRGFEEALGDCGKLTAFDQSVMPETSEEGSLQVLRNKLDAELDACREPPVDPRELCPGERPVELAPDLVIVFDTSGSMKERIALDKATANRIRKRLQSGEQNFLNAFSAMMDYANEAAKLPARISVAKQAAGRLVDSVPADVDIGLVVLKDCPSANSAGFYAPNQRSTLKQQIGSLYPHRGTPLGSGVAKAAKMVDGVEVPGVIVVISDGEESCDANVCGIARQLAASKPRLVINTVDIMGTGAGDCLAKATGGRVFTASNAREINDMVQLAATEVKGPESCGQQ